jgi:ABC-2 type transport system ATP-binding protein
VGLAPAHPSPPRRVAREPLLSARNLFKSLGSSFVLRGASLAVAPGTLVGIVGENGAGKSTLLRILVGDLRADGGEVACLGSVGYCPQRDALNTALTVEEHLRFFAAAYGLSDLGIAPALLERLEFARHRPAKVCTLSGGTRQKLNLTLALMHDPDLLVLDEPYQGFDWATYLRFWDLAEERRDRGRAVLVVSHLVYDTERFDRLLELHDGRLRPSAGRARP